MGWPWEGTFQAEGTCPNVLWQEGAWQIRGAKKRSVWLGVKEQWADSEELKAEKDGTRFRFWCHHSGFSVGGGFSGDQDDCGQTSHQAVSEETARKGWIEVQVSEMERMDEYKGNCELKMTGW